MPEMSGEVYMDIHFNKQKLKQIDLECIDC